MHPRNLEKYASILINCQRVKDIQWNFPTLDTTSTKIYICLISELSLFQGENIIIKLGLGQVS